jgi:hypothetical protein
VTAKLRLSPVSRLLPRLWVFDLLSDQLSSRFSDRDRDQPSEELSESDRLFWNARPCDSVADSPKDRLVPEVCWKLVVDAWLSVSESEVPQVSEDELVSELGIGSRNLCESLEPSV